MVTCGVIASVGRGPITMKPFIVCVVFGLAGVCLSTAVGQGGGEVIKHVTLVSKQGKRGPVYASALEVVKGVEYPSIAHLKGNVEIRANGFVLHAEQADYDEQTGEIKPSGNVSVIPYPALDTDK
jgi:lipopolysaccharide assembly outer membrane protein LptD (OstA)